MIFLRGDEFFFWSSTRFQCIKNQYIVNRYIGKSTHQHIRKASANPFHTCHVKPIKPFAWQHFAVFNKFKIFIVI